MKLDFEKDIDINPDQIGIELVTHAKKFMQYNQKMLELNDVTNRAKEKIDIVSAKLDADIRNNPEKYHLNKITETSIKNAIILHKDYENAKEEYYDVKYESEVVQAAVRAFEHRKYMLNNITQLVVAEYFAKPKNPYDLSDIHNHEKENLNKPKRRRT